MTRKDYIALAQAISNSVDKLDGSDAPDDDNLLGRLQMAQEIAHQIGNVLSRDNSRFDWARWMNACNTGA